LNIFLPVAGEMPAAGGMWRERWKNARKMNE
jgi:hypothetical protein